MLPRLLTNTLQLRAHPNVFFAGQISGVEGYVESIATGLAGRAVRSCPSAGRAGARVSPRDRLSARCATIFRTPIRGAISRRTSLSIFFRRSRRKSATGNFVISSNAIWLWTSFSDGTMKLQA